MSFRFKRYSIYVRKTFTPQIIKLKHALISADRDVAEIPELPNEARGVNWDFGKWVAVTVFIVGGLKILL